jgi:SAM-dependent methyltransferase
MTRIVELPDAEYTLRDQRRMESASRYFRWQYELAEHRIGKRVLEVGCGVGNFTNVVQGRELLFGIDIEPECVKERARRFSGNSTIVSQCLDVLDPAFPALAEHSFDSVVCLNVLEHVSDDRKALEHMCAVLRPGGTVTLIIPAFESLYGPIDERLGHFRRYSKKQIAGLAHSIGFDLAVSHYMNFSGFFGWWFNAHLLRKTEQSDSQIKLFDSWIVPIQSAVERVLHPPCGQSIFVVLRKR